MGTWSFRVRLGGNHARTCARAAAGGGGGRPVPGRARDRVRVRVWVRVRVRVPYPAWYFLNWVSRVWVTQSILAMLSESEPPRQRTRSAIRTAPPTAVCKPPRRLGGWTVAAVEPNRYNGSDRTVATVRREYGLRAYPLRYPDPNRPANGPAPLTGSKPPRQRLSVNRRGGWAVAAIEPNRCNGLDRTVATFSWVQTRWPLLERYK